MTYFILFIIWAALGFCWAYIYDKELKYSPQSLTTKGYLVRIVLYLPMFIVIALYGVTLIVYSKISGLITRNS